MFEARVLLSAEQIAQILAGMKITDRHAAMVEKHGEACTKTTAAKILSCSVPTVKAMLEDGRILPACAGERVDVRSIADYIECRSEADREARLRKKGRVVFSQRTTLHHWLYILGRSR